MATWIKILKYYKKYKIFIIFFIDGKLSSIINIQLDQFSSGRNWKKQFKKRYFLNIRGDEKTCRFNFLIFDQTFTKSALQTSHCIFRSFGQFYQSCISRSFHLVACANFWIKIPWFWYYLRSLCVVIKLGFLFAMLYHSFEHKPVVSDSTDNKIIKWYFVKSQKEVNKKQLFLNIFSYFETLLFFNWHSQNIHTNVKYKHPTKNLYK